MVTLDPDMLDMALRILVSLAAGAVIGYERSYRGRPAGFQIGRAHV